jgi:hypothetical protein
MQKWGYCTLFVASDNRLTLMDADGSRDVQDKVENPIAAMDVLGKGGWEMAAAFRGPGMGPSDYVDHFFFKRPLARWLAPLLGAGEQGIEVLRSGHPADTAGRRREDKTHPPRVWNRFVGPPPHQV